MSAKSTTTTLSRPTRPNKPPSASQTPQKSNSPSSSNTLLTATRSKTLKRPLQFRTPSRRTSHSILGPVPLDVLLDPNLPPQPSNPARKRETRSRLPRATPVSTHRPPTSTDARPETAARKSRLGPRKPALPQTNSTSAVAPSLSITSRSPSPGHSKHSSSPSTDNDKTPKRPPKQIPRVKKASASTQAPKALGLRTTDRSRQPASQEIKIVFSPITEETVPGPLTRARSRHLLSASNSNSTDASVEENALPCVRRRPSRVLQLARSFEEPASAGPPTGLGVTPDRLHGPPGSGSSSALVSPVSSALGTSSPNLSALAATLSKQHVHRDRLSRARSSISDMLRYSTMSTLGTLRWEDGAGDGLLTDQNETEAMVADISMAETTPLKPEVHSAAMALASARASFLSIVQADGQGYVDERQEETATGTEERPHQGRLESPLASLRPRRRSSASQPFASSPLARSPLAGPGPATMSSLMAHEAQLASLATSLEQSHQRELELERQLSLLQQANPSSRTAAGMAEVEREALLIEEIQRLEAELEETIENNVELENDLDHARYENEQLIEKQAGLEADLKQMRARREDDHDHRSTQAAKKTDPNDEGKKASDQGLSTGSGSDRVEEVKKQCLRSWKDWNDQGLTELEVVRSQLMMLKVLKVSLAVQEGILVDC